jgi:hypothetical protein
MGDRSAGGRVMIHGHASPEKLGHAAIAVREKKPVLATAYSIAGLAPLP